MAVYRATLTQSWQQVITCQNVIHFEDLGGTMTEQQVMVELRDNWCVKMCALLTNKFGYRNIAIQKMGGDFQVFSFPVVVNGTDGVDNIGGTMVTSMKLRIITDFPGKKGRGRIYQSGIRDQFWESGQLQASAYAFLEPKLDQIRARYVGNVFNGPLKLGVYGRGPENSGFHAASQLIISPTPGIQRRRNLGVGI
jgi:hypothetical protein